METKRRIKLDLISHLREDWLIQKGLYKNHTAIALQPTVLQDKRTVYENPKYISWVYYVPSSGVPTPAPTFLPVVSDGGGVIAASNYTINYEFGQVEFSGYTPTGNVIADFSTLNYVVSDAGDAIFDLKETPLSYIVIEGLSTRESGLQIGGGVSQNFEFSLEISTFVQGNPGLARSRTDDVVELVKRGLGSIPLIDWEVSFGLDHNGQRITAFNRDTQTIPTGVAVSERCRYTLIEDTVRDIDLANWEDSREYARNNLTFTLVGVADTTDVC